MTLRRLLVALLLIVAGAMGIVASAEALTQRQWMVLSGSTSLVAQDGTPLLAQDGTILRR